MFRGSDKICKILAQQSGRTIIEEGGGQERGLVTDHRDLKHKITNHRVFK